jgi:hydrogenase maturation protease
VAGAEEELLKRSEWGKIRHQGGVEAQVRDRSVTPMDDAGRPMRVLVVGLGNPVLRDDAVGVRLARDLRRRWEDRPNATARGTATHGAGDHVAARGTAAGGDGDRAAADCPLIPLDSTCVDDPAITHGSATAGGCSVRPGGMIDVRFLEECSVGGLALMEQLVGYDRVVVLDSMRTRDGRPADWYSFTASELRPTMNLSSVHDANFATALELGRRTGLGVPADEQIVIFAVEIEDNLTFDERMSDALEAAYPGYSQEIFEEIERLVEGSGPIPGEASQHLPDPAAGRPRVSQPASPAWTSVTE